MCLHIITDKPVVTELVQVQPLNKFLAIIRVENYKEHPAIATCTLLVFSIDIRATCSEFMWKAHADNHGNIKAVSSGNKIGMIRASKVRDGNVIRTMGH